MRSIGIRKAPETYDTTALGQTDYVPQGGFFKKMQNFCKQRHKSAPSNVIKVEAIYAM